IAACQSKLETVWSGGMPVAQYPALRNHTKTLLNPKRNGRPLYWNCFFLSSHLLFWEILRTHNHLTTPRTALLRFKKTIWISPSIIARQPFNQASSRTKSSPPPSTTEALLTTIRKNTTAPLKTTTTLYAWV